MKRVLIEGTKLLGCKHRDVLIWRNNLAMLLLEVGEYSHAETHFREVLSDNEQELGADHAQTLNVIYNLACCLWRQNKIRAAESMFQRELSCCRKINGDRHPSTRRSMENMIDFLESCDRNDEAIEFRQLLQSLMSRDSTDSSQCSD